MAHKLTFTNNNNILTNKSPNMIPKIATKIETPTLLNKYQDFLPFFLTGSTVLFCLLLTVSAEVKYFIFTL